MALESRSEAIVPSRDFNDQIVMVVRKTLREEIGLLGMTLRSGNKRSTASWRFGFLTEALAAHTDPRDAWGSLPTAKFQQYKFKDNDSVTGGIEIDTNVATYDIHNWWDMSFEADTFMIVQNLWGKHLPIMSNCGATSL